MSAFFDFATLSAVDTRLRVVTESLELFVPLDFARKAMERPATIDDPWIVSWGATTLEEVERLSVIEPLESMRADLVSDIRQFFAKPDPVVFTLYYTGSRYG